MNPLKLSAVGQKWTVKRAGVVSFSILHCLARQVLTERVFLCESKLRGSSHSSPRWDGQITSKNSFKGRSFQRKMSQGEEDACQKSIRKISCGLMHYRIESQTSSWPGYLALPPKSNYGPWSSRVKTEKSRSQSWTSRNQAENCRALTITTYSYKSYLPTTSVVPFVISRLINKSSLNLQSSQEDRPCKPQYIFFCVPDLFHGLILSQQFTRIIRFVRWCSCSLLGHLNNWGKHYNITIGWHCYNFWSHVIFWFSERVSVVVVVVAVCSSCK